MKRIQIIFLLMFVISFSRAQVLINEYSAANFDSYLDNYNEYSLKGIQESSPMSVIFFSDSNVEALQKTIRFEVFKTY